MFWHNARPHLVRDEDRCRLHLLRRLNQRTDPLLHMEDEGVTFLLVFGILEHIIAQEHRNAVKENHAVRLPRRADGVLRKKRCLIGRPVGRTARLMEIDTLLHLRIVDLCRCNVGDLCPSCGTMCGIALGKCGLARADAACHENYLPHLRHASVKCAAAFVQPAKCRCR